MWNFGGKINNVIAEMKTLYPIFENVTSELWKRFLRVRCYMTNFLFSTFYSFEKFSKKRYIQ